MIKMFDFLKKKQRESAEGLDDAQTDGEAPEAQSQLTENSGGINDTEFDGENGQTGETETTGTVEKINVSDVNTLKAEMQFDEEIEKIVNDKQYLIECYKYLKTHAEELKKMLGVDEIKFDE